MLGVILVPSVLAGAATCPLLWLTRDKSLLLRHGDAGREWGIEMVALAVAASTVDQVARSRYLRPPCDIHAVPSEGSVEALWSVRDRLAKPSDGSLLIEADLVYSLKMLRRLQCTGRTTMLVGGPNERPIGMVRLSSADSRRLAIILQHKMEAGQGGAPYTTALKMLDRTRSMSRVVTDLRWARFGSAAELAAADEVVRSIDVEDSLWDVLKDGPR